MGRWVAMAPASALAALATLGALGTAARADRAVVVGVQRYVNLPRANTLRGCVNDAKAIAGVLESRGFKVTLLTNEQATRRGILDAIRQAGTTMSPGEHFVFYFAGHGRDIPETGLMPADAGDTSGSLTPDELHQAVTAVRASARTVILDACYSGAMSRAIGPPDFRARYYAPEGSKSITPRPANHQDTQETLQKRPEVCYWTASQGNQQAIEGRFDGEYHGVFTKEAQEQLSSKAPATWGTVNTQVKGKMAEVLGGKFHQSPTITPAFVDAPIFAAQSQADTSSAAAAPEQPTPLAATLWDQYNTDRVDPAKVSMTVTPDRTAFELGQEMVLHATVGEDGYLVLLERDVDNKVYLLFPTSPSADAAAVQGGQSVRIPQDITRAFQPQDKGIEHVKAILFASKDQAESVLAALPRSSDGVPFTGMKRLQIVQTAARPFFTSEITFSVVGKGETGK